MNKTQKIEKLLETYKDLDAMFDDIFKVFGIGVIDSKIFDTTYKCFDRYKEFVSEAVGDNSDWIGWYIYDNDCGEKELEAGFDHDLRSIKTVEDLVWLIESGINQEY